MSKERPLPWKPRLGDPIEVISMDPRSRFVWIPAIAGMPLSQDCYLVEIEGQPPEQKVERHISGIRPRSQ